MAIKGLPKLPHTPGTPPVPRLDTRLPELPAVVETVEQPALGDQEAKSQQEFDARYQAWGQGSREEFRAYDFLQGRIHLQPGNDFFYEPGMTTGSGSRFYIANTIWRINGLQVQNKASGMFERASLEGDGWHVIDLDVQDLQPANAEGTLWAAIRGQEPRQAVQDARPPQPVVEAINRAAMG